jgi:hypothetical protein
VNANDPELALTAPGDVAAGEGSATGFVAGAGAPGVTAVPGVVGAVVTPGGVVGEVGGVVEGAVVGGIGVVVGGGGGVCDGGPPPRKVIGIDGRSWAASKNMSEQVKPAVC